MKQRRFINHCPDTGRAYRPRVKSSDLVTFSIGVKETDLLISADQDLSQEALLAVWKYRRQIEAYIEEDPQFRWALLPHRVRTVAPRIVREMAAAAEAAGVGPMAAVAGAVAEFVGRELLPLSPQIIIENGGDVFLVTRRTRIMSIFTESRSQPSFIEIVIRPEKTPLGVCTSSGKEGYSLSFGKADAVTVISRSAALADAAATAGGNLVRSSRDIENALNFLRNIPGITGAAVMADGKMGFWGEIELLEDTSA
jgi:ApbE superfamily uncharacterized protein (UPF0280 family)